MSAQAAREALERLKRDEAFRDRLDGMDDPAERLAALHAQGTTAARRSWRTRRVGSAMKT